MDEMRNLIFCHLKSNKIRIDGISLARVLMVDDQRIHLGRRFGADLLRQRAIGTIRNPSTSGRAFFG